MDSAQNEGYSAEERALYQRLANIALNDSDVLVVKGRSYGDSWKQRGGIGAFMMLARKWDRIENAVKRNGYDVFATYDKDTREEGIIDDIRDLRRYLLLVEDHVQRDVWNEMAGHCHATMTARVSGLEENASNVPKSWSPDYCPECRMLKRDKDGYAWCTCDTAAKSEARMGVDGAQDDADHAESIALEVRHERSSGVRLVSTEGGVPVCARCLSPRHHVSDCDMPAEFDPAD